MSIFNTFECSDRELALLAEMQESSIKYGPKTEAQSLQEEIEGKTTRSSIFFGQRSRLEWSLRGIETFNTFPISKVGWITVVVLTTGAASLITRFPPRFRRPPEPAPAVRVIENQAQAQAQNQSQSETHSEAQTISGAEANPSVNPSNVSNTAIHLNANNANEIEGIKAALKLLTEAHARSEQRALESSERESQRREEESQATRRRADEAKRQEEQHADEAKRRQEQRDEEARKREEKRDERLLQGMQKQSNQADIRFGGLENRQQLAEDQAAFYRNQMLHMAQQIQQMQSRRPRSDDGYGSFVPKHYEARSVSSTQSLIAGKQNDDSPRSVSDPKKHDSKSKSQHDSKGKSQLDSKDKNQQASSSESQKEITSPKLGSFKVHKEPKLGDE